MDDIKERLVTTVGELREHLREARDDDVVLGRLEGHPLSATVILDQSAFGQSRCYIFEVCRPHKQPQG